LSERYRHLTESEIALSKNKKEKAYFEKLIADRYYPLYDLHDKKTEIVRQNKAEGIYTSPVKSELIVSFSKKQLILAGFFSGAIVLAVAIFV